MSASASASASVSVSVSVSDIDFEAISGAQTLLRDQIVRTPLVKSEPLSALTGAEVYLKLETLQRTGSFKDRGAYVKLASLTEEQRQSGIVAISAGNHAQGVAYHAKRLGAPATIIMPEGTPFTKIARTRAHGARVLLNGDNLSASEEFAKTLAEEEGLTRVHPFNDPKIIAGQGTVGLEILEDAPELDVIMAPIGGGGLIGGIGLAAKHIKPSIEIVGVEAALYPSMFQSLNGAPIECGGETLAEGIAVKQPGEINVALAKAFVDHIILAEETALEEAVQTLLEVGKIMAEGAGAAPLAGLMLAPERFVGKKVALVICGANIDSRIMAGILMRGMVRAARLARIRVGISDQPGVLSRVSALVGETGGNIVEVQHQRMFYDVPVKRADIDIVLETRDQAHITEVVQKLEMAGFTAQVLSNSELASG